MNTPARIKAEPVPELLTLVRALARLDEARDFAQGVAQTNRARDYKRIRRNDDG